MMNKLKITLGLLLLISFALLSCEQNQSQETTTEPTTTETEKVAGFDAVYKEYLDVKQSLFQDNAAEAKTNAEQLQNEISNSSIENKEAMANAASEIANTTDIKEQRKAFAALSNEFIAVVKNNSAAVDKVFIQHCPMALDNKGASWVSSTQEIENPYMGQSMPNCGSTEETIN